MTRKDYPSRSSTTKSSSTDSWKSTDTVKDQGSFFRHPSSSSRSRTPVQVSTDLKEKENYERESQISPTSDVQRSRTLSSTPSNISPKDTRVSDFGNYRRDLAVLETSGGRVPQIQHTLPTAASPSQIAPWMSSNGSPTVATSAFTSFYNDSSDALSQASQLSPGFRPGTGQTLDSPEAAYFGDDRRPSVASVTTASSQGSKNSSARQTYKKLQGFFGEEHPGKDEDPGNHAKDARSNSFSLRHRDRKHSTSTEVGQPRDSSPEPSRPRTPVPSSDVVPFLYQDSQDISLYGEAPVRQNLSGPDRGRYITDDPSPVPPKTSSSARSGHSQKVHLPGHNHRHNKSSEDSRQLRPTRSRENSSTSIARPNEQGHSTRMGSTTKQNANGNGNGNGRSKSPTPSTNSAWSTTIGANGANNPKKHGMLSRILRHKDKDDGHLQSLKHLPGSVRSLNAPFSRQDAKIDGSPDSSKWNREPSIGSSDTALPMPRMDGSSGRPSNLRSTTFNKIGFGKRRAGGRSTDDMDPSLDPGERKPSVTDDSVFSLDLNLSNMEGILAHPPPLTPLDNNIFTGNVEEEQNPEQTANGAEMSWNAPDSWAVRKINDDNMSRLQEIDEAGIPPKSDEKAIPYCIRVFRGDGTFATLSMSLNSTVGDTINQLAKKTYMTDNLANYQIIMKRHDLRKILKQGERPVVIQKRLLEQAGYEERDKLEDVGREDNSYLCRFLFVPTRESGYAAITQDPGFDKVQKFSHVDLSGRNLITIPIALYSRAAEIISINLSRNLSLDLPMDFVQSCLNLREIKYVNNEAFELPPSISSASRLTILDVSNNRLEQLQHAGLAKLQGLISLKLANNRLREMPQYFDVFKSMRTLNVSSNFLEEFPSFLCGLEGLVDIDFSFNSISNLPQEIGNLKSLERFVMTNNRLTRCLPDSFGNLSNLKEVDIRYNALTSIDIIASLPRVEQVSADHNQISIFEGTFEKIRILRLNSNPVTKFEIRNHVPTLTTLILSNAKLAQIPDAAFDRMPNLVKLVLDKNHFVSLPSQIGKLTNLEHFSIAINSLSSLPAEMGCLTELRFLDLRQNNLKKLPNELWWANKLETLNISSNMLSNFPKPGSRGPQAPGDSTSGRNGETPLQTPGMSRSPSFEELGPLEGFGQRRPSQASGGLLSVGPSPVPGMDRKASLVSLYGKGGRKTSVVSRKPSESSTQGTMTPPATVRKDSGLSAKLSNTFSSSLKNLYLADNELDDDVFDQITLLVELRVLNLSYNDITDIPLRSFRSWPQLVELYLSGNELTSLPSDDFDDVSLLQILHINGNKFQTLPAELGKAHRLAVLDCGSNSLKYNVSNWPYDWNWNYNTALRYLNFSGNKRLEIKPNLQSSAREGRDLTDFSSLQYLRILGLMDVTLTIPTVPDETEDRRVRTSGSLAGSLAYGMADALGKNEHLSIIDMVVPRFNGDEAETLLGMFDGQALSSGGSKIAKYLHENFGHIFADELNRLNPGLHEKPEDALRRAFLSLNKDLATAATQNMEDRSLLSHRGSAAPAVLSQADLHSGGVATVMYLHQMELYVANVGDAQAMLIHSDGGHRILTRKHDPAEPNERQRIRDAGGWVSRQGKLNDILEVSRAFGYVQLMPAVQAAPHITHITLKEQDEMIIIASKELWEFVAPELVVDVARGERLDFMRAAQKLRDLAMAYGATGKIMVMIFGVADLKKRERFRLNRGTSMSMGPSGMPDEGYLPNKRGRRAKGEAVEDSMLRRLEAEVQAPVGDLSIVFTDIKNSTSLWENHPSAMRSAIKLHNEVMRRQLRIIGGYEVKTEGDAFMVSFPTATSALLWCFSVQQQLLEVPWPSEVLNSTAGEEIYDNDRNLIFRGLSVRMGIHFGNPLCEIDIVTRRMDYYGPMVNRTARISGVADGGQITVSSDFISEIQRCLETYSESERSSSTGSEDTFENDVISQNIRRELRSLSSQGFEVKDMGERKLKGLENPEYIYLMYPHALSGRIDFQPKLGKDQEEDREREDSTITITNNNSKSLAPRLEDTASKSLNTDSIAAEAVWALWSVSLRLEKLCEKLEIPGGPLNPPQYAIMEKMRKSGGEVTDKQLLGFMQHLTSRIEAAILNLAVRELARSYKKPEPYREIEQLAMPMDDVILVLKQQAAELQAYKAKFGNLSREDFDPDSISAEKSTAVERIKCEEVLEK